MDTSKVYEAADMLEHIAKILKDKPEELIEVANNPAMIRYNLAGYLQSLANDLRAEEDRGKVDGR